MNKNNNLSSLDKDLPATTHEFLFDLVGSVTKKRYVGEFVCKIPNIKDQSLIARREAALNGDHPGFMSVGILNTHKMLAYLQFTLTDFPKFWRDSDQGFELRDLNIIEAVYTEVLNFEDAWLKKIWGDGTNESKEEQAEDSEDPESEKD